MSSLPKISSLAQANIELREKNYVEAIKLYEFALKEQPDLEKLIKFNIKIALDRLNTQPKKIHYLNEHEDQNFLYEKKSNIAVVIHVFYEHLWPRISQHLKYIKNDFDLIITTTNESLEKVSETILQDYPKATILAVKNAGMDVLPFITAIKKLKLWRYLAVLKIHTKNDKSEDREIQGKMLLDGVLGSEKIVAEIISSFRANSDLGLVGPEILFRSADLLMYNNRDIFNEILNKIGIQEPENEFGFIAGTIFWIKGSLLNVFDESYPTLEKLLSASEVSKTGADGTYAHAMERVFGVIPTALGFKTAVTYPSTATPLEYSIKIIDESSINSNLIYRTGSATHVTRYKRIQEWTNSIKKSNLFNDEYYIKQLPINSITNQDPSIHYTLHGDLYSANPSPEFNSRYYTTRYKDIARSRTPALIHFINHGKREGRIGLPEEKHWIELAFREELLNTQWISQKEEVANILRKSDPQQCQNIYSKNYNPQKIPKLSHTTRTHNSLDVLKTYLDGVYQDELEHYDLLERNWSNKDYTKARDLAISLIENYGDTRAALEVLASCDLLLKNWDSAKRNWSKYWRLIHEKNGIPERCKKSILKIEQATDENGDFDIIDQASLIQNSVKYKEKSICVYTTLFGDIDNLLPIVSNKSNLDFICFTDRPREAMGWDLRIVKPEYSSQNLSAKIYKILPHKHLPEYEHSLFVDANTLFLGRLDLLTRMCRSSGDFVMWRHPFRRDVFREGIAIITSKRHEPKKLIAQIEGYSKDGLPNDTGLTEGSFIWRSHTNKEICTFMENWWDQIINGSNRDQVSLGYLMWRDQIKPQVFPASLGSSRSNIFFVKVPHNFEVSKKDCKTTKTATQRKNIVFLYSEKYANSGSTVMRGEQLSGLIKEHFAGTRDVSYTSNGAEIKNSILFLTKGYIKDSSISDLEKLKKAGNILLCDFVDDIPDKEKINIVDALIASSISGYKHYMTNIAHIPSFHITHHVDPRVLHKVMGTRREFSRCEIGYFGELVNTQNTENISQLVQFHNVDTSKQDASWIDQIADYNCHYAVRQRRGIDGFKPFLKGFTAAATGSNIIIQANEGDAAYYLGSDYPYLVSDTPSEEEIISTIQKAKESYKTKEWDYALDIMRDIQNRSSMSHIRSEFDQLIKIIEH